jgi:hypothetical protein
MEQRRGFLELKMTGSAVSDIRIISTPIYGKESGL